MGLLITAVVWIIRGAIYLIIAGVLLSMLRQALNKDWMYSPLIGRIIDLGDSLCRPFRRLMDKANVRTGMFDFSPLLAIITLEILERVVISLLLHRA